MAIKAKQSVSNFRQPLEKCKQKSALGNSHSFGLNANTPN